MNILENLKFTLFWHLYFGIPAGRGGIDCRNNLRHIRLDDAPSSFTQDDDRDLASGKVLLKAKIAVRRHQHLKTCGLGHPQKFSIFQFFPSSRAGFRHGVAINQVTGKGARCAVVKQNEHLRVRRGR